ncbi:MAG: hypothetical protein JWN72_572 [Thermoleophilia bacterium]|nr:hypothetical protein [Thermoleophilia bacterium]
MNLTAVAAPAPTRASVITELTDVFGTLAQAEILEPAAAAKVDATFNGLFEDLVALDTSGFRGQSAASEALGRASFELQPFVAGTANNLGDLDGVLDGVVDAIKAARLITA